MRGSGPLRVGEVARRAGVNVETLRYYERRRLIEAPDRSLGGHRLYSEATVTRIRIIKAAQRLGFTLREVAGLIGAGQHHHERDIDGSLRASLEEKLAEVERRLSDLEVIRRALVESLDVGCHDLEECASTEGCPLPFLGLARSEPSIPGGAVC